MGQIAEFLRVATFASLSIIASIGPTPASADCYENIGCTDSDWFDDDAISELSCENLWHVRNRIYDENGYCFATDRGREAFDNSDCWIENQADVELSEIERHNVEEIVEAEDDNDCDE